MNTYTPDTPRSAFALLAAALTAITIGVFVVLPATQDSGFDPAFMLAARESGARAPVEVAINPARIDVIAAREPNVAWALEDKARPNCKPEV